MSSRQGKSSSSTGELQKFSSGYINGPNIVQDERDVLVQSLASNVHNSDSSDDPISDEDNSVPSKLSATSGAATIRTSNPHGLESGNQLGTCAWSAITGEFHDLVTVFKKTDGCPCTFETSEAREIHTGDRGRTKLKFSFRSLPRKGNLPRHTIVKDGNNNPCNNAIQGPALHKKLVNRNIENSIAALFGDLQDKSNDLSVETVSHEQRDGVPSIAELLEDLQHGDELLMDTELNAKANLGSRILDDEDPQGVGLSSDDEDNDQSQLCVTTQKFKGHTMTDLFQEVFSRSEAGSLPFPTGRPSGIGYYGRLQQVLQIEKDRLLEFLKKSPTSQSPNDSGCMDVQIISRFLEAKLTVCQCLFSDYNNSSLPVLGANGHAADVGASKRTVIFNSRICENVELEIGNLVRIHAPWKEVQVNGDGIIILCMYFSQLTGGSSSYP